MSIKTASKKEFIRVDGGYEVEHFSADEIARIRKKTLGYGNFKKTAKACAPMPLVTFRDILNKGYGTPANVAIIRNALL
jgi:hypothetical protein